MKRLLLLAQIMILMNIAIYSQDTLVVTSVKKDQVKAENETTAVSAEKTYQNEAYDNSTGKEVVAQDDSYGMSLGSDKFTLGLGLGMDHGGLLGVNVAVFPQRNIGLFGGLGYNMVGIGFNGGLKLRIVPSKPEAKMALHGLIMYGYNTAIKVSNATELNKVFYGPTLGVGFDLKSSPERKSYMTFSLLIPIRGQEVNDYIEDLENNHGVVFQTGLLPIALSFGWRFIQK